MTTPGDTTGPTAPASDPDRISNTQGWSWHPELPVEPLPLFAWPPNPKKIGVWLFNSWLKPSTRTVILAISVLTWFFLQPALERCVNFEFGWIAHMYVRNLLMMIAIAGALHLYFYVWKKQGRQLQFDDRAQAKNNRTFTFNDQVRDNIFWSLASGVTVWTAYEVILMWAFANGFIPMLNVAEHPVWFVFLIFVAPIWNSMHFYWVHRLLHWRPLYLRVHALHHRNINIGPWAGMSMHPVEHILYLSSVLLHAVIASHPIHVFYTQHYQVFNAVIAHAGFESLLVKDKRRMRMGNFYHQLHHRYVECNYGNGEMPWDRWFGSSHDGTPESRKRMNERRRRLRSGKQTT